MTLLNRPKNKAVLPAEMRFDRRIPDGPKLAYGEIVALCGKKTYCWPKNEYLADLLNKCPKTISRALKKLSELGLIEIKTNPEKWNRREIHLLPLPGTFEAPGLDIVDQGAGHLEANLPASLLIVENNDISNDRSECSSCSKKINKGEVFFKGSGLMPANDDIRNLMDEVPADLTKGFDLDFEARKFYLHYSGNGWKMGRSQMVCLPSAIEKWFFTAKNFKKNVTTERNINRTKSFSYLEVGNYTGQKF